MVNVDYYNKGSPTERFPLVCIISESGDRNIVVIVGQPGEMSRIIMSRPQAAILSADLRRAITRFDETKDVDLKG